MTENEFCELLNELLCLTDGDDTCLDNLEKVSDVRSFENAGILTNNKGLVVNLEDGSEFQVTIVKSN